MMRNRYADTARTTAAARARARDGAPGPRPGGPPTAAHPVPDDDVLAALAARNRARLAKAARR